MIRCVVFDFDGTLVLSNDIKREGFFAVVSTIPDGAAQMKAILSDSPGDRYAIFHRFVEEKGGDADVLVQCYTDWCEEQIVKCKERQGAETMVGTLRSSGISIYVNSATPTEPLCAIILRRFGAGYFNGVLGGHGGKGANLRAILAREHVLPSEIAMVGDGVDDRDAANVIGCHFFGVDGGTLAMEAGGAPLLRNLEELWPLLRDEPKDDYEHGLR